MDVQRFVGGIRTVQGALRVLAMLQLTAYRYPPQAVVRDGDTFDFIVVGGGTAGSVVANRLSEVPGVRVLLIEAGGDPPIESLLPGLTKYLPNSHVDWNETTADDGFATRCHKDNVYRATRGKMLGGTSGVNYMGYLRGHPVDYNDWARITNDLSWSFDHVLPYFKKSQRQESDTILQSNTRNFHGTDGYMGVIKQIDPNAEPYLNAFAEIGHQMVIDVNSNNTMGYGEYMFAISNGVRQSTAESHLASINNRQNLFILKNALATKILFDEHKHAIGVQLINSNNEQIRVMANIEVVLSAGPINSPKLLMLSGVGPERHLRSLHIPLVANSPVGQNLLDQISIMLVHILGDAKNSTKVFNPHDIPSPIMNGFVSLENNPYPNYQTLNIIATAQDLAETCSSFAFDTDICQKMYDQSKGKEALFTFLIDLERRSTGKLMLRTKNPIEQPIIKLNAFGNRIDLDNAVRYVRDFVRVQNSSFFKRNNAKLFVPDCAKHLKEGSDEYFREIATCLSTTLFRFCGSCPMGSVLDSRLRVVGVSGIRVVDGSSIPALIRANPNTAIIMIAEQASDMIKQDNGLLHKPVIDRTLLPTQVYPEMFNLGHLFNW